MRACRRCRFPIEDINLHRPLSIMVSMFCGVMLGLLLAQAALDREFGFNQLRFGPWVGNARLGGIFADPYSKAMLARSGELPLGGGEGLTLVAERDSAGHALSSRCTYVIAGDLPPARYWTLTVSSHDGSLLDNPSRRFGFTSSEIVRGADGKINLVASSLPRAGNWIPLAGAQPLRLTLRLYDTPLANESGGVQPLWPAITRLQCP